MGIVLDLWFEETGRMAKEAERSYNRFMQDHPYVQKTSELTEAVLHPNKSVTEELEYLLEPETEDSGSLEESLETSYEENNLDEPEEDQYYDR